jgi:hypothetical protein
VRSFGAEVFFARCRAALLRGRSKDSKRIKPPPRPASIRVCSRVSLMNGLASSEGMRTVRQRQRNGIRTLCPFLCEGYKRGIQWPKKVNENGRFSLVNAGIAQLVEQLICNQQVVGSNPTAGSLSILDFRLAIFDLRGGFADPRADAHDAEDAVAFLEVAG